MDNNSLVLVCSICDSVGFELSRVNKDSLSFKCTECGAFINIKNGLVGKYNIDKSKLKIVMPVRPVHDDIKPQKEWVSMSFRVTQASEMLLRVLSISIKKNITSAARYIMELFWKGCLPIIYQARMVTLKIYQMMHIHQTV